MHEFAGLGACDACRRADDGEHEFDIGSRMHSSRTAWPIMPVAPKMRAFIRLSLVVAIQDLSAPAELASESGTG